MPMTRKTSVPSGADLNSLFGAGNPEPKRPTFQSKTRKAFRIVEVRLCDVENQVREARDAALNLCESVLKSVPVHEMDAFLRHWRAEYKRDHDALRARIEELERKLYPTEED